VSVAKTASLGVLFVTSILVARTAGPEGLGYYNTGLTLLLLFDAIVGQPLDNAMIRYNSLHHEDEKGVVAVQGSIWKFKMFFGSTLLLLSILFIEPLTEQILGETGPRTLLPIVAISLLALLAIRSTACLLQIRHQFKHYAALDSLQGILRLAGVCVLFALGISAPETYIGAYGGGALMAFLVFLVVVPQEYILARRPTMAQTKIILSYIGVTSAIIILGSVTGRADVLLMMIYGGPEAAGHYSAAAQLAFLGALFAGYIAVVFQPKVVQMAREGQLGKLIRLNGILATCASLLCIPFALWGLPWLMPIIFGTEFDPSIRTLQILLIGSCSDLFVMPVLLPFAVQVLAREVLIGEVIITVLFFVVFFISPANAILKMAWLVTGIRLLKFMLYHGVVLKHLRKTKIQTN
jgi:O-antigen/teichoic acid export membrane protein